MLIKDYYIIDHVSKKDDGSAIFQISLRADSVIYEGHFPGEPVAPGVCNIQMIKECAEQILGKPLLLKNLQQCKLTTLVTPVVHPKVEIIIRIEEKTELYKLKATLGKGEDIYLELKAELTEDTYKVN